MNWIPINGLDDRTMIRYAANRHLVRLDDGRVAILTGWPGKGSRLRSEGRRARIINHGGQGYTLPIGRVLDVSGDAP